MSEIQTSELVLATFIRISPITSEAFGIGVNLIPSLRCDRAVGRFENVELTISGDLADPDGL